MIDDEELSHSEGLHYSEELKSLPRTLALTIAAFALAAIGAHFAPEVGNWCYVPAALLGIVFIPMSIYADYLHS